jgi:phosphoglycerate dehydrogenase-like enzyme
VVLNLFPDREDNIGVLNASLFELMPPNAVFMNMGRGRQVEEAGLIRVMKTRPDVTALLDVQCEEPPPDDSELYTLPNIRLSAHIAGSKGRELARMADYMIEEFLRFEQGEPLRYQVEADQL